MSEKGEGDKKGKATLPDKLLEYKDNNELLQEWGKNARPLSIEVYDKSKLSAQVADVLEIAHINK